MFWFWGRFLAFCGLGSRLMFWVWGRFFAFCGMADKRVMGCRKTGNGCRSRSFLMAHGVTPFWTVNHQQSRRRKGWLVCSLAISIFSW
jgi:uncharacterized membrane protein